MVIAVFAFLLGALLVGLAISRHYFDGMLPQDSASDATQTASDAPSAVMEDSDPAITPTPAMSEDATPLAQIGTIEGRLAMLEDRLSRIDYQSNAASGNAARAEGLLIAFAARRMVDEGKPLSYVADQLRLRFSNAQPNAVDTIISFSKDPVTIDELSARLLALAPQLTDRSASQGVWSRMTSELGSLFVVRRDNPTLSSPAARVERARLMLISGRIPEAIDEVERLPGADLAKTWIADARRYSTAQRALDLLETTAMLEPSRLNDATGHAVNQSSPLSAPVPQPITANDNDGPPVPDSDTRPMPQPGPPAPELSAQSGN